jgi:hypothetical protein
MWRGCRELKLNSDLIFCRPQFVALRLVYWNITPLKSLQRSLQLSQYYSLSPMWVSARI